MIATRSLTVKPVTVTACSVNDAPATAAEVKVTEPTCQAFKNELRASAIPIEVGQSPCVWKPVNFPCGMAMSIHLPNYGQKDMQAEDHHHADDQELREFIVCDGCSLRDLGDPAVHFRNDVDDHEANEKRGEQESNHAPTMHPPQKRKNIYEWFL